MTQEQTHIEDLFQGLPPSRKWEELSEAEKLAIVNEQAVELSQLRRLVKSARLLSNIARHIGTEITNVPGDDEITDDQLLQLRRSCDDVDALLATFDRELPR